MRFARRASWGARYEQGEPIRLPTPDLFLHHDTFDGPGPDATVVEERAHMRRLEDTGQARFGSTVSYSLVVFPSGRVYEGAGIGIKGTHTGGRNSTAHGVVCVGNYETAEPSPALLEALRQVRVHGKREGWWAADRYTPHSVVKATACPGRHLIALLRDVNRAPGTPAPPTPSLIAEEPDMTVLVWTSGTPGAGRGKGSAYVTDLLTAKRKVKDGAEAKRLLAAGVRDVGEGAALLTDVPLVAG